MMIFGQKSASRIGTGRGSVINLKTLCGPMAQLGSRTCCASAMVQTGDDQHWARSHRRLNDVRCALSTLQ